MKKINMRFSPLQVDAEDKARENTEDQQVSLAYSSSCKSVAWCSSHTRDYKSACWMDECTITSMA